MRTNAIYAWSITDEKSLIRLGDRYVAGSFASQRNPEPIGSAANQTGEY